MLLAFAGDIMMGRMVNEFISAYGPGYPWGNVLSTLKKADIFIANLECVISSYDKRWTKPKAFYFRAKPLAIETLKLANVSCVNLANNHTLDYQEQGLLETIELLDTAGIRHCGAGKNIYEAMKPAILEKKFKAAVLGFADQERDFAAAETKPGINYIPIDLKEKNLTKVRDTVKSAKSIADLVIFSMHWGPNMALRPSKIFTEFAHRVIDFGADIFHGHSAHLFQGIEIYRNKLIMYDTGDLVDDYYVGEDKNDQQLLFFVKVTDRIEKIEMIPLHISNCQVNLASEFTFDEICGRMTKLSAEFVTKIRKKIDRMVIEL